MQVLTRRDEAAVTDFLRLRKVARLKLILLAVDAHRRRLPGCHPPGCLVSVRVRVRGRGRGRGRGGGRGRVNLVEPRGGARREMLRGVVHQHEGLDKG